MMPPAGCEVYIRQAGGMRSLASAQGCTRRRPHLWMRPSKNAVRRPGLQTRRGPHLKMRPTSLQLQGRLVDRGSVTVTFTSRAVDLCVSLARARRTYSPGAVNVAVVTAFPSFTAATEGSNSTAAGPRHTSHVTDSPCTRGRGGGAIDGTLVGEPGGIPSGKRKVGGFSEVPPLRPLPGAGSPSSVTSAVNVSVDGRLTDVGPFDTLKVGVLLLGS